MGLHTFSAKKVSDVARSQGVLQSGSGDRRSVTDGWCLDITQSFSTCLPVSVLGWAGGGWGTVPRFGSALPHFSGVI